MSISLTPLHSILHKCRVSHLQLRRSMMLRLNAYFCVLVLIVSVTVSRVQIWPRKMFGQSLSTLICEQCYDNTDNTCKKNQWHHSIKAYSLEVKGNPIKSHLNHLTQIFPCQWSIISKCAPFYYDLQNNHKLLIMWYLHILTWLKMNLLKMGEMKNIADSSHGSSGISPTWG